jgi:CxxC-x17-CxxC domain-containing protein
MAYFNRDTSNRSGRDNRGGGRGFGGGRPTRNDGPREMFKTVCSSCGKNVKFHLNQQMEKPVYCSECFDRISPRTDRQSSRPERSERNDKRSLSFQDRPQTPRVDYGAQFESLNAKMDKLITLLTPKTEEVVVVKEKVVKTPKVKNL